MNTNSAIIIPPPSTGSAGISAGSLVTNDIRAIKPPVEIASGWFWVWIIAAVLLAAIAGFLIWRHLSKATKAAVLAPLPPHVRAKRKLQGALGLLHDPRLFCILVSDTIRVYLEERFRFHAPDRTTEEFMAELQSSHLLDPEQKESLAAFLQSCDLVKFARYEPAEAELRALLDSALRLIDQTQFDPLEAAQAPAQAA